MATKATTRASEVEEELMELERRYWQALKDRDMRAASELNDERVIVTGAQGVGELDRKAFEAMAASEQSAWTLEDFSLDDLRVHLVSDDVAIVAYKVHEEITVKGKRLSLDAADASTWIRRDGAWRCALHTESLLGDPFGRDRRDRAATERPS